MLITTSADQTIKLWEITFGDKKQPQPKIIYDHEEEITSAFCSQQNDTYLLATVDLEGWVIIRDLTHPDDVMMKIRPEFEEYTTIEFANVCLNNNHALNKGVYN